MTLPVPLHMPDPRPAPESVETGTSADGAMLRSMLDGARIGIWEADLGTRQVWRSAAHAAIFGYPPEASLDWSIQAFQEHVHPDDRPRVDHTIREGVRTGTGWDFECRIRRRDEALRWIAVRSAPVPGGPEPSRRFRGIVMDITERKGAEMAARETERQFAAMANSAPVLIWTSDIDKRCNFFNEPWLAFTGRSLEQESGNGWAEGVHPEDRDRCLQVYTSHFDDRLSFRMEYRLRRHDGAYRWILGHGVPRHLPDGSFAGYIGSCIDITEQKELEAARREARKLAAIGNLAGGMAHEFNNILAAMLINIGLAQRETPSPGIREALAAVENSCVRAGGLIRQLLAFGQKSVFNPRHVELGDFINRQVSLVLGILGEGMRLSWAPPQRPLHVLIDPALLEQALHHLCRNAADSMPGGGVVQIGLASEEVGADRSRLHPDARPGHFARLSVSDQGCGMDARTRERLFEPFFTTKATGQATGLGLATVLGVVRQHQGWVEVESEPGRGSCFRVYLPLASAAEQPAPPLPASHRPAATTATILLAEDDPNLRLAVSLLLSRAGYRVLPARDAAEARNLWNGHAAEIDLLLSDVIMPGGKTGLELAQELLESRPGLRVILTSGFNEDWEEFPAEIRERLIYLAKPIRSDSLLQTIQRVLAAPASPA